MKELIIKQRSETQIIENGKIYNDAIASMFSGKRDIPLQTVTGSVFSRVNHSKILHEPVTTGIGDITVLPDGMKTDSTVAENRHKIVLEDIARESTINLGQYGKVVQSRMFNKETKSYATQYRLKLNNFSYSQDFTSIKGAKDFKSPKKASKIRIQKYLPSHLGFQQEIVGLAKEQLELQKKQKVLFVADIDKTKDLLKTLYREEIKLKNGSSTFKKSRYSDESEKNHMDAIKSYNGKYFPIVDDLESRARAAKQVNSIGGFNLYGKGWETKCLRLGYKTVAYDFKQLGYVTIAAWMGIDKLVDIAGLYGNDGDIYIDVFLRILESAFGKTGMELKVARELAKKPAQMLIYGAGMKTVLLNTDSKIKDLGSIFDNLCKPYDISLEEASDRLDMALRAHPEMGKIMEIRDEVNDSRINNYVAPSYSIPDYGTFYYERISNSFDYWDEGGKSEKHLFNIEDDNGDQHKMTMFASIISSKAKMSADLPFVAHLADAYIRCRTQIDVIKAGGKCLVKHDEYIVNKEHEDYMLERAHHWLTYVLERPETFFFSPLRSMGIDHDLESMRDNNVSYYGKDINFDLIREKKSALSRDHEMITEELKDSFGDMQIIELSINKLAETSSDAQSLISDFIVRFGSASLRQYIQDGTIVISGKQYKTIKGALRYAKS